MEAILGRIEAQLIEQSAGIRLLNSKVDSALQTLDSKVDSALQDLATLSLKVDSIVHRLPDGLRSDVDGELATPSRNVRHRQRQRSLMELPVELQSEILVRMPVKSILSCKCVCKHFNNIIQNPNFIQTHLNRITPVSHNTQTLILGFGVGPDNPYSQWDLFLLSIDYTTKHVFSSLHLTPPIPFVGHRDQFHFVGSCNGLICVLVWYDIDWDDFFLVLWNPVIKHCRYLPKSQSTDCPYAIEFGYVSETNDYLIVKVNSQYGIYVEMYKLSIDSWVTVECSMLAGANIILEIKTPKTSVFLNESFHWNFHRDHCTYILYYKIKDDRLEVMKGLDDDRVLIPDEDELNHYDTLDNICNLAVIDESLALIFWNFYLSNKVEVWVMNEYGVEDSWAIRYQIVDNISSHLCPVGYWTNGNLLIIDGIRTLMFYNLHTGRWSVIPEMETNGVCANFYSFVETLVRVNP